jgi:hypothetical protein
MHLLGRYEKEYSVFSEFLARMKDYRGILKTIPYFEYKRNYHFKLNTEVIGKKKTKRVNKSGISKKDFKKMRYLWLQLLRDVRFGSEEKSWMILGDPTDIRKKFGIIRDHLVEDLDILDHISFVEDGKEYGFDIEVIIEPKKSSNRKRNQ